MYNYTIIIPHKNIPDLLRRCLASIPERDDVEIIVVDDNSDVDVVNFKAFPSLDRKNTRILFEKGDSGKGPGFARNQGLLHAQGKWIIFADADDYFTVNFTALLDKYAEAKEEILFFTCQRQNLTGAIKPYPLINDAIDQAKSGNTDAIVYGVPCPWGKFIKRDFLQRHTIRYQEITGGDDILFSLQMAIQLKHFKVVKEDLYCIVDREGSLTRNTQWKSFWSYILACCDAYVLLLEVNKQQLAVNWLISWWGFLWAENKYRAVFILPRIFAKLRFKDALKVLRKGRRKGAWKWEGEVER